MNIKLERPLVFLDIESTGIDREHDRIIELSLVKMMPDGEVVTRTRRLNPTIPIPPAATEVHGITDQDVKDMPTFAQVANGVLELISGCDLAGYNSINYDFPMLFNEFMRAGINWNYDQHQMVDVGNIFKIKEERTLSAAVQFYCGKELDGAHGAEADTLATVDVLKAQLDRYDNLPATIPELALYSNYGRKILDMSGKFSENENGDVLLNFGKYRGELAKDHLDFVDWMYTRANFPADTNRICQQLLKDSGYNLWNGFS